jgi:two-component system, OmpR family, phosphate regulon sensor histidine kinase PhoR
MRSKKLLWKTYVIFAFLSVLPLIVLGIYSSSLFRDSLTDVDKKTLAERTALIKEKLETSDGDSLDLQKFALRYDNLSGARVTIILPNGKVVADSRENPAEMDNHADRPEVIDALEGKTGISQRYSFTLKEDFIYSAMPVYGNDGKIAYVLRSGYPLTFVQKEISGANSAIFISVIFFSIIVLTIGFILLKNTFNPLDEIRLGAERFSKGDFEQKIYSPKEIDLKNIAESLNFMAKQLDEKLDIIGEQSNLQQVVLQSMKEGILAVDYEERILLLNETAASILSINDINAIGKTLQEVVRISEIQKFFKKVLSEGESQEAEIILQHGKDKFLQLSGTLLLDIDKKAIGALVVFNDITNLKHLDTVKKELVANVSHELRTPVTTIKGFIETLKEGAIEDPKNSERFLNIISKHIDRLNMLIDDLLILSKLEESRDEIKLDIELIKPVLKSVVEDYEFKAGEKKIDINIKCDDKLTGKINKHLMEQAIGNLLDNAIKYSDKKTQIEIGAYIKNEMICIYVEDEGYGIAEEHLPRLFERFYRIDKARSREEGGTGLGLAIVKHIVNTMNGLIDVDSTPGKGTVFTIKIHQN